MEVSSPSSAAHKPAPHPLTNPASVLLPLRFILTGLGALFTGTVWLVFRPQILSEYHYNQYVVSLTHLFVLGWIASVIMGAMYQLVPVALETRLHSERLARWHFPLHLGDVIGMVWMFWIWDMKQVGHFGSFVGLGILIFAYNIGRTLKSVPRWNVVAGAIASALVWLTLGMCAGLYVAAAKCWSFSPFDPLAQMHAHAHLGGVGFFIMMLVGVSYKLIPMFTLSEIQNQRRAWRSIHLLNLGLAGLFVTILLKSAWKLAFALVIIGALTLYARELTAILRARKRRELDWGVRYFITGVSALAPLSVIAVILSWPGLPLTPFTGQLENVYGLLALLGVLTFAIAGMLYKIVPFLVWFYSYSGEVGRKKVPSLADLYARPLQAVTYWAYLAGLTLTCVAAAMGNERGVQAGVAVLALSLAPFAVNMARILSHLVKPRLEPLPARKPAAATKLSLQP